MNVRQFAHQKNSWETIMHDDPIVNEVRKNREELFAKYGYDLSAMFEDMKRRQFLEGRKVVSFERKTGEMVVVKEPQKPYGKEPGT